MRNGRSRRIHVAPCSGTSSQTVVEFTQNSLSRNSATATTPRQHNPSVSQRRQGESVSSDLLGFRLSIGMAS